MGLVKGGDAAQVRPAMASLIAAVADHFAHEEALMRKRGYPSRARHEEAHMLFVADAKRFQAELERNGVTPGFAQWASSRLPEWFRYHILGARRDPREVPPRRGGPGPAGDPAGGRSRDMTRRT